MTNFSYNLGSHLRKQALVTGTLITSIEIKFYKQGALTPTVSLKFKNFTLDVSFDGIGNGQNGGLQDEVYVCAFTSYGYKDWVNNQSFGIIFSNTITAY